mmetsp:Transcript_22940/g.29950  ORF Transcript_22940/g.29950 Transcript_22940/m.29950 type:complete len:454 (+) Transcript_22940:36-1397(+)
MGASASLNNNPSRARERFLTKHYTIYGSVNLRSQLWKAFSKFDKNANQQIILSDATKALSSLKLEIDEAYLADIWKPWLSNGRPTRFYYPQFITFLETGKLPSSLPYFPQNDSGPNSARSYNSRVSFASSLRELHQIKEEQKKVAALERQCQEQKARLEALEKHLSHRPNGKEAKEGFDSKDNGEDLVAGADEAKEEGFDTPMEQCKKVLHSDSTPTLNWTTGTENSRSSGFGKAEEKIKRSSVQDISGLHSPPKTFHILGYTVHRLEELEASANQGKSLSKSEISEFKSLLKRVQRVLKAPNTSPPDSIETIESGWTEEEVKSPSTGRKFTDETIYEAAKSGDIAGVKAHVSKGFDLRTLDDFGNSVLYYGSLCGHLEICHYALQELGGKSKISKNEMHRCETNALNPFVKHLINGSQTYEELQEQIRSESNANLADPADNADGLAILFAEA